MNLVELIGPVVVMVVGLLVLWWGVACRNGRFRRNPILGYRTVAALRSTPAWNAAHRGYAPWIILAGLVLIATGAVGAIGTVAGTRAVTLPSLGAGIVVMVVAMAAGGVFAHRSLAAHLRENEEQVARDAQEDGG